MSTIICKACGATNFGGNVQCKTCKSDLRDKPAAEPLSFLQRIRTKWEGSALKKEQEDQLKAIFRNAMQDGVLTDVELEAIDSFHKNSELSDAEFMAARDEVFLSFVELAVSDRRVTQ